MKKIDLTKAYKRGKALERNRQPFIKLWKDVSDFFTPHRGRYFLGDDNKPVTDKRSTPNSDPFYAASVLQSGLMSGMTSPGRPWFTLSTGNVALDKNSRVAAWLYECTTIMYSVFAKSNLYNSLHTVYGEASTFATSAMGIFEHPENFLMFETQTAGQYSIGIGADGKPESIFIERDKSVAQIVKDYGIDNCPDRVKNLWEKGDLTSTLTVCWLVEPNDDRDATSPLSFNKKYRSLHFLRGSKIDDKPLRLSGFDDFAFAVPRWDVCAGDVYGTNSPALTALGDAKALQLAETDILQAMDRVADPVLLADESLRKYMQGGRTPVPGTVVFTDSIESRGVKEMLSSYRPEFTSMANMADRIGKRIERAFHTDLFLMLSNTDRRQITAREVVEKHEEKLLQLGPVYQRLVNELLDPLISRSFSILQDQGLFPDPPEELQGRELSVEYVSVMAQAQRMMDLQSTERAVGFAASLAQFDPTVGRRIDSHYILEDYIDRLNIDPRHLRPREQVEAEMAQEQQQAMAAQQMSQMSEMADTAETLSKTQVTGDNALTSVLRRAGLG